MKKLRRCNCGEENETNIATPPSRDLDRTVGTGSLARGKSSASELHTGQTEIEETPETSPEVGLDALGQGDTSATGSSNNLSDSDENSQNNDSDENDDETDETTDSKSKQPACEKCASEFYAELEREMTAASKAYFGWTLRILTRAPLGIGNADGKSKNTSIVPSCASGWPSASSFRRDQPVTRLGKRFVSSSKHAPNLKGVDIDPRTEARECLRWVDLNATALRKILKKWDKTNESLRGREALAKYWKKSEYQMLHSPVTLELRAVAGMLQGGTGGPVWNTKGGNEKEKEKSFGMYPSSSFGSVGEMDALTGGNSGVIDCDTTSTNTSITSVAESPTCGVCLDTLYKPVGLECGHVFCRDCLLRAAGVLDHRGTSIAVTFRGRQTVSQVASGEAASEPEDWRRRDKCPECRHEGVFLTSTRLRHVEACIKKVDPVGHAQRRLESKKTWSDATKFAWRNVPKAVADALKHPSGSSAALSAVSFAIGVIVAVVAL